MCQAGWKTVWTNPLSSDQPVAWSRLDSSLLPVFLPRHVCYFELRSSTPKRSEDWTGRLGCLGISAWRSRWRHAYHANWMCKNLETGEKRGSRGRRPFSVAEPHKVHSEYPIWLSGSAELRLQSPSFDPNSALCRRWVLEAEQPKLSQPTSRTNSVRISTQMPNYLSSCTIAYY